MKKQRGNSNPTRTKRALAALAFSQAEVDEWLLQAEETWTADGNGVAASGVDVSPTRDIAHEFANLVSDWKSDTENVSSITRIVSHPSYQSVIEIGRQNEDIVRLILSEFSTNNGYWATALRAIMGENPVSPKSIGDPQKVKQDWLDWGKRKGYF